uniref:Phospholysine phosphohistidine inorganic pyrophosphate phosphatase n=1 Tax=Syphacia muris TaxID=451379 RepID=A0A0N5ACT3_9BILA
LRLYSESNVRFISNDSCATPKLLAEKLSGLGINIDVQHVFTPISAAIKYIQENHLRPHLLVHKNVKDEFAKINCQNPNCVVLGDAEDELTYENLNHALRVLIDNPLIVSLGFGKFYRRTDGYVMDVGCYAKGLQYATNARIEIIGKPSKSFFYQAIQSMNLTKDEVVMIGDDIDGDIGAAQALGIKAVLVRTGKWREEWEKHVVKPDLIANSLFDAVEQLLG